MPLLSPEHLTAASDIGEFLAVALSAVACFAAARGYRKGEPLRTRWALVALGVAAFAVGDATWSRQELVLGIEPAYPGWPDAFYLLRYPLFAAGMGGMAIAWRRLLGDASRKADRVALGTLVVLGGGCRPPCCGPASSPGYPRPRRP